MDEKAGSSCSARIFLSPRAERHKFRKNTHCIVRCALLPIPTPRRNKFSPRARARERENPGLAIEIRSGYNSRISARISRGALSPEIYIRRACTSETPWKGLCVCVFQCFPAIAGSIVCDNQVCPRNLPRVYIRRRACTRKLRRACVPLSRAKNCRLSRRRRLIDPFYSHARESWDKVVHGYPRCIYSRVCVVRKAQLL